ncbi:CsbD family protein [Kurthia senegalensis]|uniref:CsbD family protein n=1 Tax=Kurthia senegalensis TaxID=1033740 RepID=UPI000288925D|nr:CsbD family protein [Kurthia senegalensis]
MSGFSDKLKAGVNKAKGEVKEQVGNATDNAKLQADGKLDKAKAAAQEKVGEVKDKFNNKKD